VSSPAATPAANPAATPAATFDDLPDGLLVTDASGAVSYLNPAGARLLRRPAVETLGLDYREVLPLSDSVGRDWWACTRPFDGLAIRSGQPERRLTLPDDRELYVTARYLRQRPRGAVTSLVISFRGAAERERTERDRADLISTVAHELRSPLTSVKGFTATLLAKWDRFNDEQRQLMLRTVNADADRVTRLITELLDVSRIDADRLELRKQVVDVPSAVQRAVDGRIGAGDAPERFQVTVGDGLAGLEIWLDPDKLDQVLANLLDNAVRHGAGLVGVQVEPGPDGGVVVSVSDEGEGVPADIANLVFRRFWRAGRRGGTGLGLYIVKGLVEAHGGVVGVEQSLSGGARFVVRFPPGTPDFA
jgi:signal transduction histidine kinase